MERMQNLEATGQSPRARRPRWRTLTSVLVIVAAIATLTAPSTSAARAWCMTDPLIMVNGELANILVSSTLLAPLKVTGPTEIVITTPEGVNAKLIIADLGFGRGQKVTFKTSKNLRVTNEGIQMQIAVMVPSRDGSMPVAVSFAPRILGLLSPARAEGTANEWIVLHVTF